MFIIIRKRYPTKVLRFGIGADNSSIMQAFFKADILICDSGKSTGINSNIKYGSVLFEGCSKPDSVSEHVQFQHPETEAAKWNSALIHTPVFLTVTCQHVLVMQIGLFH